MKEPYQHPLDNLYPNNSLLLLEALIPYVDPSLKFPLAMLIKVQELRFLMQAFNNPSHMESCGLNRGSEHSEEMISTICRIMGFDFQEQLNSIHSMQNMMNTMNMMQTMQSMQSAPPHSTADQSEETSPTYFAQNTGSQSDSGSFEGNGKHISPQDQSESPDSFHGFSQDSKNDMIAAIRQILSEQEGEQNES